MSPPTGLIQTTFGDKSEYLTRKKNPRGNTFKDTSEGISWAEGGRCTADGLLNQQLHRLNTHEPQLLYNSVSRRTHLTERETERGRPSQRTDSPILGRATTWGLAGRGLSGSG